MFEGGPRFLDCKDSVPGRVAYATFPRTGNTFLRKYFENITGVFTGSEMAPPPSLQLLIPGMLGENVTDQRVWIAKSHHPI